MNLLLDQGSIKRSLTRADQYSNQADQIQKKTFETVDNETIQ